MSRVDFHSTLASHSEILYMANISLLSFYDMLITLMSPFAVSVYMHSRLLDMLDKSHFCQDLKIASSTAIYLSS